MKSLRVINPGNGKLEAHYATHAGMNHSGLDNNWGHDYEICEDIYSNPSGFFVVILESGLERDFNSSWCLDYKKYNDK